MKFKNTSLLLSIYASKMLTSEQKTILSECVRILEKMPEMKNILKNLPYHLNFSVSKEADESALYNEIENTVIFDHLYFVNTPPNALAVSLAATLCHANQKVCGLSYSSNQLFFDETFLVAKLQDVEANLKTAQLAERLSVKHPLGDMYHELINICGKDNAPTEMAQILWNGLLPTEFAHFKPFMEEQVLVDNMAAYHNAYSVHGLVENPLKPRGKQTAQSIYKQYTQRMHLDLPTGWWRESENCNIDIFPYFYLTKNLATDEYISLTLTHPLYPEYTSVLEVESSDFLDSKQDFIYQNKQFLYSTFPDYPLVYYLLKNQLTQSIRHPGKTLSAAELDKITIGSYLMHTVSCGSLDQIKNFVERCPEAVNYQDIYEMTPLGNALLREDPELTPKENKKEQEEIIAYLVSRENIDLTISPLPQTTALDLISIIENKQLKLEIIKKYFRQQCQKIKLQKPLVIDKAPKRMNDPAALNHLAQGRQYTRSNS